MERRRDLKLVAIGLVGLLLLVIVSTVGASPAAPQIMNYQGRLTDSAGNPLNGTYSITFKLYNVSSGGTAFWTETHSTVSVTDGLFNVLLGSSNPLNPSDFTGTTYLGVKVGSDPEMTPRQQIVSVAYALVAATSESGGGAGYWAASGNDIYNSNSGCVGIGTSTPSGRLTVSSIVGTPGTVFRLPAIANLPDPSYTHGAVMQWEGGETKFGIWRQYFNGYEQSWALTYNAPWDYTNNQWLGRDSGDARANHAANMRFNVAEGGTGQNTFEINFAKGAAAGVPPDWNDGAHYWFYDGHTPPDPQPARLMIRGAASMDAILELNSHESVDPLRVELVSDGLKRRFEIRDKDTAAKFLVIDTDTGIYGATASGGTAVYIKSDGQLGTLTSSARFKTGIVDLGSTSDVLYDLRPVAFEYKPEIDPVGLTQYGLIAEEVAEVAPDLVIYDEAGDPYTVRYEQLVPLLLNEVQKLQANNEALLERMAELEQVVKEIQK